ncbi:unnamed protein product [Prorocentrum cordatum]|uniref:Uncharacterized protein n=1 Tax=Prorocentrum cordatum TaxID=2364126 RepID=A0ABN9PP92_9DINO|nr:unnamed protein product [Polarella glacialis]
MWGRDMRAGEAAEAGMLRLSHSEAPLGVHLDVELALHCVRVALAPASWQELAGFLAALQVAPATSEAAAMQRLPAVWPWNSLCVAMPHPMSIRCAPAVLE